MFADAQTMPPDQRNFTLSTSAAMAPGWGVVGRKAAIMDARSRVRSACSGMKVWCRTGFVRPASVAIWVQRVEQEFS